MLSELSYGDDVITSTPFMTLDVSAINCKLPKPTNHHTHPFHHVTDLLTYTEVSKGQGTAFPL